MKRHVGFLKILLAAASAGSAVGACTVGPDYKPPELAPPPEFRGQQPSADDISLADVPWQEMFKDAQLQALIEEGLRNSPDLAIAAARIEQARALVGVASSEGLPQIGYEAGGGAEKTFVPEPDAIGTTKFAAVRGLLTSAWELDLWGRIKRTTEAARANLGVQEQFLRAVHLTLVSDIASGYFNLLRLDRELAIAEDSNQAYRKILDLFSTRFEAGRDSKLPVERTQAAYDSSSGRMADLKRQIEQQENALSVLTGAYPRAVTRGVPLTAQSLPAMPPGLTTDLLRRRPDIRQAEQVMIRANAEVGVAVANFYPRIGLAALLGGIAVDGENGIGGSFGFWSLGAKLAGPIFTGGRLESIYNQRKAFWDESVAQYRKTVLTAFQETSNALAAQQNLVGYRAALERQVGALRRSVELAVTRYDSGRSSYFEVLEAQQQLFPAEDELARVQQAQLLAVVSLYKALGGGWGPAETDGARPS